MGSCNDQDLINELQLMTWGMKSKFERMLIVLSNALTIFPGIIYFLTKVYGSDTDETDFSIAMLILAQVAIPLFNAINQVNQGLLLSFKVAKTTLFSIVISSIFYLLALSPTITKKFKDAFSTKASGIIATVSIAFFMLFVYIIGFSEINYSKKHVVNSKCSIKLSKLI